MSDQCYDHAKQGVIPVSYLPNPPGYHRHNRGQKVFCDLCGGSGYGVNGRWMDKHRSHSECDVAGCGKVVTTKGLAAHKARHKPENFATKPGARRSLDDES